MSANFVHLHVHTTYSMLDGACQIKPLVQKVKALGMKACAITDHGNVFGIKHFYDVCRENEVKPILGCEAYVATEPHTGRTARSGHHLILLAKNLVGYHNLVKLISIAHTEGMYYTPRIDKALLEKYHEGLICSSACIAGEVPQLILDGHLDKAEETAAWFKNLFGEDYYLEIMFHKAAPNVPRRAGERPVHELQAQYDKVILEMGRKLGIKVIATNDVHFLNADDAEAHDILLCVSTGKKVADENRLHYTQQEWFKSYDEMLAALPENAAELANTLEIADKVEEYELNSAPILPVFPIPASFGTEEEYRQRLKEPELRQEFGDRFDKLAKAGIDKVIRIKFESDYLESLTWEGAKARWPKGVPPAVHDRIAFELETIKKMGFPGYFLIVRDYISAARSMGVSVGPGRGSAAGSVVAYCLKITNVNPIDYDLLFERFLNPDRISMPDIDEDFDDDGRQKVLEYVTQKYGTEHVAHIVTFGQMAPKSAIKDVCRVMDVPIAESNRLAGLVPNEPKITMKKAVEENPELKAEFQNPDPTIRRVLELASKLDGSLRQPGVHACGIIISRDPLIETIPIMPTENESLMTTQYDGHFVEPIGLLKMDFLGLKTLTVIKECLASIKDSTGKDIDIDAIPLDDKPTYELFTRGDTTGLFQFESDGMKKYLRELKPSCLEDLVAMNALYRPGPMQYIPQFIARKHGREAVTYDHPLMEKYLKTTYGICVYQEQVMLLSRLLSGFTRGQSDTLRKAMGKKKISVMEELKAKFVAGCLANPEFRKAKTCVNEADARKLIDKIWEDWRNFASYAFNKSHAVCYAYVAYQTGYLKAHYPAEFMCAQISSEIGNFDKLPGFVNEAADMGLAIMPPDVNESRSRFAPGNGAIRYGLAGIKGVGTLLADKIVEERRAHGPYKDFLDFCERTFSFMNRRALETLVKCGALDGFKMHRARMFNAIENVLKAAERKAKETASGQGNLFEALGVADPSENIAVSVPDCDPWPERETLKAEREFLGIYVTGHPLKRYRRILKSLGVTPFAKFAELTDRTDIRVGGVVTTVETRLSKRDGKPFAILGVDDGDTVGSIFLFSDVYQKNIELCAVDTPVLICGQISKREGQDMRFRVQEFYSLADAPKLFAEKVVVALHPEDKELQAKLAGIQKLIASFPGTIPMLFCLLYPENRRVLVRSSQENKIDPSAEFLDSLSKLVGPDSFKFMMRPGVYKEEHKPRWAGHGFGDRQ